MAKKKRSNKEQSPKPQVRMPVLHGDAFRTFIDEATSLGNEVMSRRQWSADVVEYLRQKGLFDEWNEWFAAKHPQS